MFWGANNLTSFDSLCREKANSSVRRDRIARFAIEVHETGEQ